jgi:hypothetical protein
LLTAVDFFIIPIAMVIEGVENAKSLHDDKRAHETALEDKVLHAVTAMDGFFILHLCVEIAQVCPQVP